MRSSICILASLFLLALTLQAAETPTTPEATTPRPYPERLQWWADGRFGMFIHWGPVSLKGTEISWSRANTNPKCPNSGVIPADVYDNLYKDFNPTHFDAAAWVQLAKAAGAKYIVLTAKHCDGFLLWHSQASDYNISRTPFGRDVCAELAQAARAEGIRIGWYFSPMDWRDPDFRTDTQRGVPGPDAGGSARTAGQLRSHRPAVVRLGRARTAVRPGDNLRHRENAAAGDRHQQPARPGPGQQRSPDPVTATRTTTRPNSMSARTTTNDRGSRA